MDGAAMQAVRVPYPDSSCAELGNARASSKPQLSSKYSIHEFLKSSAGKGRGQQGHTAWHPYCPSVEPLVTWLQGSPYFGFPALKSPGHTRGLVY